MSPHTLKRSHERWLRFVAFQLETQHGHWREKILSALRRESATIAAERLYDPALPPVFVHFGIDLTFLDLIKKEDKERVSEEFRMIVYQNAFLDVALHLHSLPLVGETAPDRRAPLHKAGFLFSFLIQGYFETGKSPPVPIHTPDVIALPDTAPLEPIVILQIRQDR